MQTKKYEEAGEMQGNVLDLCKKVLGPEHPDTLTTMENIAVSF